MILFTSVRPLERAENIKAVYDAYDGDKVFVQRSYSKPIENIEQYSLMVTDGLVEQSPGKYLWIGHGMGAGKTIGLQHPTAPFHGSELVTYAIASSVDIIPTVAEFCGISQDKVIPLGMPRTDAYFQADKPASDKKHYLYAPTFRGWRGWHPKWDILDSGLFDTEVLTVKPHMVNNAAFLPRKMRHIVEASKDIPSTPFLLETDVLVTDYSSIMFDAYVMRKPVVLFAKDKFRYLRRRGMYCQYPEWYSDFYCDNENDLLHYMRQAKWTPHMEELRRYHAGACDGRSTKRCIELIKDML